MHIEMRVVRWMCNASLSDKCDGIWTLSEDWKSRMDLECISVVKSRGRPKKTYEKVVQYDLLIVGLNREAA